MNDIEQEVESLLNECKEKIKNQVRIQDEELVKQKVKQQVFLKNKVKREHGIVVDILRIVGLNIVLYVVVSIISSAILFSLFK